MKLRKKFIKLSEIIPQLLLLLSLFTSNVLFPTIAIAQELDNNIPVDESEDILDEGISTSVYEEAEEPLFVYEDGIYTVNTVVEGEEYVYPDNEDVSVRFSRVTEDGNLVIKRVELSDGDKEELNTSDDFGWDITSSMSNGSFTYDLTLPNTYGSNDVEVKYTEDGSTYEKVDSNLEIRNDVVTIEGLEHFTVFVVTGGDDVTGDCSAVTLVSTITGDTCYETIQAAVDNASDGETVNIKAGMLNR